MKLLSLEPESSASANSATSACAVTTDIIAHFTLFVNTSFFAPSHTSRSTEQAVDADTKRNRFDAALSIFALAIDKGKKIVYNITTIESRNPKYFDGKSKICKQISIRNLSISVEMI